jgi:hypothetical protein
MSHLPSQKQEQYPWSDLPLDSMQLADELPMIYTVCIMCFATFSYRKSPVFTVLVGAVIFGLAWFITVTIPSSPGFGVAAAH